MNLRRDLDELEQYERRLLIRLCGIPESSSRDTKAKILEATSTFPRREYKLAPRWKPRDKELNPAKLSRDSIRSTPNSVFYAVPNYS